MSNNIFQQTETKKIESVAKELNIDIPVESITLPSKGLIYSAEHPFCNAEFAEVRSPTARDEDLLTSRALIKNGTVISRLIESCLINKSVSADDLLVGDRNAILIAIRILGYGSEYEVKVQCPECGETFDNTFSLNGLRIKELSVDPVSPNTNLFSFDLPSSKLSVVFKLLTGKDESEISVVKERKRKNGMMESEITTRLFYSIVSINGQTDKNQISKIISNMRAGDSRALRNYMDKIEPKVDMSQEIVCKHCSAQSEVDVPLGASFFWPN